MTAFFSQIQKWRFLSYEPSVFLQYRPELDQYNLKTLSVCCAVVAVSCGASGVAFAIFQADLLRLVFCLVAAAVTFLVHLRCRALLKASPASHGNVTLLLTGVSLIMYLCSIYLGTVASDGDLAVICVWLFLFLQIAFDVPPLQNLATVLPCYVVFLLSSHPYKAPLIFFYDAIHATCSMVIGFIFSYRKSWMTLTNIVNSDRLRRSNYALYHTSTTDELTGLPNRRQVFERMEQLREQCQASGGCLACAVLDLDDFKQYNDRYGHPAGDALLRKVGKALLDYSRERGIVLGRIGGEEFLAVWMTSDLDDSGRIAEELRDAVAALNTPDNLPEGAHITISAGLCVLEPQYADRSYAYADKALYRAKDGGKNRSCIYEPELDDFLPLALPKTD